ncbi:MAG TPA: DinB family protein [Pyrinomonadaceae bacterium]
MTAQEFSELVQFLEETPEVVRQLTAGWSEQALRWKPSEDEFSALEQVCHLRDIEREGYSVRIRKILAEERPMLPDIDGSRLARTRHYNSQSFDSALEDFAHARQENIGVIRALPSDQLNRSGALEGVGEITLERLLLLMREHDQSHRDELRGLMAYVSKG